MSAAIQLVNPAIVEADFFARPQQQEKAFNQVSAFELAAEQRTRRQQSTMAELQAEVNTLREELSRAERSIAQYETLLRNALVREQELRAQMFKKSGE